MAFIVYGVVGVELNALELEDPFGDDLNDLPLKKIVERIRTSVQQMYRVGRPAARGLIHATDPINPSADENFWF